MRLSQNMICHNRKKAQHHSTGVGGLKLEIYDIKLHMSYKKSYWSINTNSVLVLEVKYMNSIIKHVAMLQYGDRHKNEWD